MLEDFITEARDITDSMIANAQRYGIIDSDPWGEESLNSVASKFFAEENFTKESLAIFFGEGLVRVHGVNGRSWPVKEPKTSKSHSSSMWTSEKKVEHSHMGPSIISQIARIPLG